MYILVTKQLITMFLIMLCGFIFAKVFRVQEIERKFLSKLLLYFINPCIIINSFNKEFNNDELKKLLFVGIPLPGTGAWTGTLAASFLNMKFKQTVIAVMLGVLLAGLIMMAGSLGLFSAIFAVFGK